jgi:hypothetical protein
MENTESWLILNAHYKFMDDPGWSRSTPLNTDHINVPAYELLAVLAAVVTWGHLWLTLSLRQWRHLQGRQQSLKIFKEPRHKRSLTSTILRRKLTQYLRYLHMGTPQSQRGGRLSLPRRHRRRVQQ